MAIKAPKTKGATAANGKSIKGREEDYTANLKAAVEDYLRTKGQQVGLAFMPNNRSQSVDKWPFSKPHDLVAWLKNGRILVLEVKIQQSGRLAFPYPRQYDLNSALEKRGHPLHYCINLIECYATREQYLSDSQAIPPSQLYDGDERLRLDPEATLRQHLDALAADNGGTGSAIAELLEKGALLDADELTGAAILIIARAGDAWLVETLESLLNFMHWPRIVLDTKATPEEQVAAVVELAKKLASKIEEGILEPDAEKMSTTLQDDDLDEDDNTQRKINRPGSGT